MFPSPEKRNRLAQCIRLRLDPDGPSALSPQPLALSSARVAPAAVSAALPVGKPCLPSLSAQLLALLTTSAPLGQSSSFVMAAAVPAQVGETFGIDLTGSREALASPAAAWRG